MRSIVLLAALLLISGCQPASESALVFPAGELVDMSYAYNEDTIYWPTAPGFTKNTDFKGITDDGFYYTAFTITTAEHGGTHLDAPIHFFEGRNTADEVPLDRLMGAAVVVVMFGMF